MSVTSFGVAYISVCSSAMTTFIRINKQTIDYAVSKKNMQLYFDILYFTR